MLPTSVGSGVEKVTCIFHFLVRLASVEVRHELFSRVLLSEERSGSGESVRLSASFASRRWPWLSALRFLVAVGGDGVVSQVHILLIELMCADGCNFTNSRFGEMQEDKCDSERKQKREKKGVGLVVGFENFVSFESNGHERLHCSIVAALCERDLIVSKKAHVTKTIVGYCRFTNWSAL